MRATAYESLHAINAATQQITDHIERLKAEGLLTPHFAELRTLAAEQNCAETSLSAILALAGLEQQDAARIEKERSQKEQTLRSIE
jgi:hypothetical protein